MTAIGATSSSVSYTDRAAFAKRVGDISNGRINAEQVLQMEEKADQFWVKQAVNREASLKGEGTYLGHSKGNKVFWDYSAYRKDVSAANAARVKPYLHMSGPVKIEAVDVDSTVSGVKGLTGGDLKSLSTYAD